MPNTSQQIFKGFIFSLIAYSAFALMDATVKYLSGLYTAALGANYSVLMIMVYYGLFAIICTLAAMKAKRYSFKTLRPSHPKIMAARSVLAFISQYCAFAAFARIPLATGFTLIFVAPFVLTLLASFFLKEKINKALIACLVLGFGGALVVLRPGFTEFSWGMAYALGCVVAHASSLIILRKYSAEESVWSNIFWQQLTAVIISALLAGSHFIVPELRHLPLYLVAGLLSAGGTIMLTVSFYYAPASRIAAAHYIQILWGLICGYFIFNDTPDEWVILGCALIIGSGLYIIRINNRLAVSTDAPP